MQAQTQLQFPIIIRFGDSFVADSGVGMKAMGAAFPDSQTMLIKESWRGSDPLSGWIVDSCATLREFHLCGKRREWARPLAFLWRFTLSEYRLTAPRQVTIRELKRLAHGATDSSPETPVASDFRRFLAKYPDDVILTPETLQAWPL